MKNKAFLISFLSLVIVTSVLLSYAAQKPFLKIEIGLELLVQPETSSNPGMGWIIDTNTNITLAKWPTVFHEKKELKLHDDYGEEREKPLTFVVYSYFNQSKKEIASFTLSKAGRYFGAVSSVIPEVHSGKYNITLQVLILEIPERQNLLKKDLFIP